MRLRSFFLNYFNTLLFLFFLSSPTLFGGALSDEQADEVYRELLSQWKPVHYKQPLGFETIFQELDPTLWPALPESYEWRVSEDKKVHLFKHELAADHMFDFVTYATDSLSRFHFLSRWDGITYHSFAYARHNSPLSSYSSARAVFPISEFRYNGQTYMRGHCIDFLDTHGLSENSKVGSGTIIESISTLDPRNYVPEPRNPSPYWGETLRKNLVGEIRQEEGGCYAQYMYYGLTPLRTDDETATAIPQGIYFVRTKTEQSPLLSYHVPWSYHFTSDKAWSSYLEGLQVSGNFYPAPFVHDPQKKRKGMDLEELPLTYQLPKDELLFEEYDKIVKAADHEIQNVMGKMILIQYLLERTHPSVQIQAWLKRLIDHALAIHQRGGHGFMETPAAALLMEKLAQAKEVDEYRTFADWLAQIRHNDQGEDTKRDLSHFSPLKPLKISDPSIIPPIVEIDVSKFKKPDAAVRDVIEQLKKEPRVRLLNMTTSRAKAIASTLKSQFPDPSDRKKISIEYTPNQGSPQTKGIRPAFTNIGITPIKVDSLESLPSEPTLKKESPTKDPQQRPESEPEQDFKNPFEALEPLSTDLNVTLVQKIQRIRSNQDIVEYLTCPTAGDGDCFFHAAFTEPGDSLQAVQDKAAILRRQLCDAVQQGQYVDTLRPLVYEYYIELLTNDEKHPKVPETFQQRIQDKNRYTSMYNDMQYFHIPADHIPGPEEKFPVHEIQALIEQDHIKAYMEKLRNVGDYESYIPFRPEVLCPLDILARIGQKQINLFTFNETEKKLQFHKRAGTDGPAINILHTGNHFIRLCQISEEEEISLRQCEQIRKNYLAAIALSEN